MVNREIKFIPIPDTIDKECEDLFRAIKDAGWERVANSHEGEGK